MAKFGVVMIFIIATLLQHAFNYLVREEPDSGHFQ